MSYHIYHTPGLILDSKSIGESNRLFYVYTEQFGNVVAVAQGVRELKSKLRFSLTDLSLSNISIVRGKEVWRITSAESAAQYQAFFSREEYKKLVANVCRMVKRLVPGEAQNKELFHVLHTFFLFIQGNADLSREEVQRVEYVVNLKILATLGYATDKPSLAQFIREPLSEDLTLCMEGKEKLAVSEINNALSQSQL